MENKKDVIEGLTYAEVIVTVSFIGCILIKGISWLYNRKYYKKGWHDGSANYRNKYPCR